MRGCRRIDDRPANYKGAAISSSSGCGAGYLLHLMLLFSHIGANPSLARPLEANEAIWAG